MTEPNRIETNTQVLGAMDLYEGVDRLTQGERRLPLPAGAAAPLAAHAAKEIGTALVAG